MTNDEGGVAAVPGNMALKVCRGLPQDQAGSSLCGRRMPAGGSEARGASP